MSGGTTAEHEPVAAGSAGTGSAGAGSAGQVAALGSRRPSGLLFAAIACLVGAAAALTLVAWGGLAGSIPITAAGYLAGSIGVPMLLALHRADGSRVPRTTSSRRTTMAAVPVVLVLGLLAGTYSALLLATELAK